MQVSNFSFELFYEIFTEDTSLLLLYHGAKKSKMTKNSNQGGGGPALISRARLNFRRRPILCTTLYRNLMQAGNFDGTFDQRFL